MPLWQQPADLKRFWGDAMGLFDKIVKSNVIGAATSALLGKKKKKKKQAAPLNTDPAGVGEEVKPLAMPDEAEIRRNKRRKMLKAQQRGGRMSTILSDKSDY